MQFIDTHTHLQDDKSSNATEIIRKAYMAGCQKMICVSAKEEDWEKIVEFTNVSPENIVPAFAIHPWYVSELKNNWSAHLAMMLQKFPQALIGECGLDGLKPNIEKQKQVFAEHIRLAEELKRPLIIHAVKAVALIEEYWDKLPQKFVIHGYNGKAEFLKKIIQKGGYIGVGNGLLKHPQAKELLKLIPNNKILFESDAPFQSDGAWAVKKIIETASRLLEISVEQLSAQAYQNSLEFIK